MTPNLRICPRCGHENVSKALWCFQCGLDLNGPPTLEKVARTQRVGSGVWRLAPNITKETPPDHKKPLPPSVDGQPLTCLKCGTLNQPNAERCTGCQQPLIVPDDEYHYVTQGSARTSIGQVRSNNEDNLNLWASNGVLIALIADGMGGAVGGEEASRLVIEAVQADFLGEPRGSLQLHTMPEVELGRRLAEAIRDANRAVIDKVQADSQFKGMGTTSTLMAVRENRVLVAHVGDSRAYHVDAQGKITQISTDHSFVQALVSSGHITEEEARSHPMGNVLYRALGQGIELEVDLYLRFVRAGDHLVICSDGLTRHVLPLEIGSFVHDAANPAEATEKLIALANKRGGEDNVSVIVIQIIDKSSPAELTTLDLK